MRTTKKIPAHYSIPTSINPHHGLPLLQSRHETGERKGLLRIFESNSGDTKSNQTQSPEVEHKRVQPTGKKKEHAVPSHLPSFPGAVFPLAGGISCRGMWNKSAS
jgi:hypothetical protein